MIVAMLTGFHYGMVIKYRKCCPVPALCGTNRLGKTTSASSAISLTGNTANFYSSVNERFFPPLCSRSTVPPVLDDVKTAKFVADIARYSIRRRMEAAFLKESMFFGKLFRSLYWACVSWEYKNVIRLWRGFTVIRLIKKAFSGPGRGSTWASLI